LTKISPIFGLGPEVENKNCPLFLFIFSKKVRNFLYFLPDKTVAATFSLDETIPPVFCGYLPIEDFQHQFEYLG